MEGFSFVFFFSFSFSFFFLFLFFFSFLSLLFLSFRIFFKTLIIFLFPPPITPSLIVASQKVVISSINNQ